MSLNIHLTYYRHLVNELREARTQNDILREDEIEEKMIIAWETLSSSDRIATEEFAHEAFPNRE